MAKMTKNAVKTTAKAKTKPKQQNGRQIMHVSVGIDGVWEPSQEDLDGISKLFSDAYAAAADKHIVVATRYGVSVSVVNID